MGVTTAISRHGITLPADHIAAICERYGVRELAVFGSLLRDDFTPDSDIDFLVVFRDDDPGPWMGKLIRMEDDLRALLGGEVDLVPKESILKSENWIPPGPHPQYGPGDLWIREGESILDIVCLPTPEAVVLTVAEDQEVGDVEGILRNDHLDGRGTGPDARPLPAGRPGATEGPSYRLSRGLVPPRRLRPADAGDRFPPGGPRAGRPRSPGAGLWDDTGFVGRCPRCGGWIHFTIRGKRPISPEEAGRLSPVAGRLARPGDRSSDGCSVAVPRFWTGDRAARGDPSHAMTGGRGV